MPRKIIGRHVFTGRGALSNPPGRFDLQQFSTVDDGWYTEEEPSAVETTLEPERAKELITTNDSPDVPFERSINPYRGCSHGCVYCLQGDTLVLLGSGHTRPISELRVGDEIYGTRRAGDYRYYAKTRVLAHWSVIKPAYRVTLQDGTTLVAGGDHRFLTERGWKFVTGAGAGSFCRPHLTPNNRLKGTGSFARGVAQGSDYRRGYLCGMVRGDAHLGTHTSVRSKTGYVGTLHQFRLALCDQEALLRARDYLLDFSVPTQEFQFQAASGARRALRAIRAQTISSVEAIRELIAWPAAPSREWSAGFMAGIFDAEGSFSHTVLRIPNTDAELIARITECLRLFSFAFVVEHLHFDQKKPTDVVRLKGGLREHLRFFHTFAPAISRKLNFAGQAVKSAAQLGVVGIEPLKTLRLYDITTETGDFIANGVISHNCYARPSHAYMGLSPGLDFETRIFYKQDAARVLEQQLARPGYVCKPITIGANTDPYQPDERRMKVTRSILEVFARTRHPVTVITKGALILRDLDLLTDLARDKLAGVAVSVTTLDSEIKRVMEPRTASPQARLRAVKELNAAGVPTGVLVAPVIPALTDHELEDILAASAAAGARWAGYVLLRLPYEIKDLFREWLAEHFPERAAHVMSVLREMRGGRDNDPRFGSRMRGTGVYAQLLRNRFQLACKRLNLNASGREVPNTKLFRPPTPPGAQMTLGL
jgi:DNA repair photolyase